MKFLKRASRFIFMASLIFIITGCSNNGSSTDKEGKVSIEFFNQKKEMSGTLKEIIKDFEKDNPNINVKETDVPNAGDVLKTRMLAGDIPDVINIYPQNIDFREWAKAGYFEDISNQDYIKNLKNSYAAKYKIDGKIYNAPLTANMYGFYYNKTEFDKLGLETPKTWKEFENLVEKIISLNKTPFAIAGTEGWTLNGYHSLALATVTGSDKKANQYLRFSKPNSISVNDEIFQEDKNRLDLLRKDKALQKNWQGAAYNDALVSFASGESLITPNGSWALTAIKQQDPKFEIATFPFPGNKDGQELIMGAGDFALSISSKSKNKEAANKFVTYLASPKAMQKYYDIDGSPTAVQGVTVKKDSELSGLEKYAFTDKHLVWLGQSWNSENDFFTLTANYILTGDENQLAKNMNSFFNPMKVDVK